MNSTELHEHAMDLVTRLMLQPPITDKDQTKWEEQLDEAVQHITDCPSCLAEIDVTIRVLSGGANSLSPRCEAWSNNLPAYAGMEPVLAKARFPWLWVHMQTCADCHSTINRLRQMVIQEQFGKYGSLPRGQVFGSQRWAVPSMLWQIEKGVQHCLARIAVVREEAVFHFQVMRDNLLLSPQDYPPGLMLQQAPVRVRRDSDQQPQSVETLVIPTIGGLNIRLTVYPTDSDKFDITVQLQGAKEAESVSGASVRLKVGKLPLPSVTTDEEGSALLRAQRKVYTLEIAQEGEIQRVELDLTSA